MNLSDKVPKRLQPELRHRLRAVWNAPSRRECELRRDELAQWLRRPRPGPGRRDAVPRLGRPDDLLRLPGRALDPPADEQPGRVGLRRRPPPDKRQQADAPARLALYLVFKITQRLELGWRPLNGGLTLMTLLLRGARFVDGIYIPADVEHPEAMPGKEV